MIRTIPSPTSWYENLADCRVLKESKSKRLLLRPADSDGDRQSWLVKIYLYPGLWQTVKYCFRPSKARRELALAGRISEKGIPTIVPREIKDIRRLGLPRQSLVLAEYLPDGRNLEELLIRRGITDRRLKRRIIEEYGRLARRIHDQGIDQEDFDPNNILYQKKEGDSFQLYFLDFERTRLVREFTAARRVRSLARLNRMGRKLNRTDQLRFLAAYLGPQATRQERRAWVADISREEDSVRSRDQRRAARQCTSENSRVGFIRYNGFQGYYRKKHHDRPCYSRSDTALLAQTLEALFPGDALSRYPGDRFVDFTASVNNREERFQVRFFQYGGLKYRFLRIIKKTPLLDAWRRDNGCLKNRSAAFMPVAALEKKAARNRYHGFLIRKN